MDAIKILWVNMQDEGREENAKPKDRTLESEGKKSPYWDGDFFPQAKGYFPLFVSMWKGIEIHNYMKNILGAE